MAGEKGKHTVAQAGGKSVIKGTKWADPVKKMANQPWDGINPSASSILPLS